MVSGNGDNKVKSLLASIIDSSDDAIIGKTLDGIITSWNKGAERMYGYKAEEVIGQSLLIIFPKDLHEELFSILDKIKNGERVEEQYTQVQGRNMTINFMRIPGCFVIANELINDIFSNIIGNAIKHSDPNQPLNIDVSIIPTEKNRKKYYKVIVEDNGPGIPDELKSKIFSRLQRGKTRTTGKGLGLYLVKTLVQNFHGRVWVEDRVTGDHTKGARFVVMLPAV